MRFAVEKLLLAFLFTSFCSWNASAEETYTGSGFFITTNGYFVTNYHVIKDADKISLRNVQGKTYEAVIVKTDKNNDLALLKVNGKFSALPVINSQTVKRGADVITVGFPNIDIQGKEPKLSEGIISALSGVQDEPTVFQISVPIQPGNSGGPLVNMDGNVVGIIASKLSTLYMLKNKGSVPENVNYAIKSNYLNELIQTDNALSKLLPPPSKRSTKNLVDLSEHVEKAIALVFVVRKIMDVKALADQCSQAVKEREYADALIFCKQAAKQGNEAGQYFLGWMYSLGKGVTKDIQEAKYWFQLSAAQGSDRGQFFLGMQFDGEQNYQEAIKWYRLAAAQGNSGAQVMIGVKYFTGYGVTRDYVRAMMWFLVAGNTANAVKMRQDTDNYLTPAQRTEVVEMAKKCLQSNYKNCD
jgi:TPR repeat protein